MAKKHRYLDEVKQICTNKHLTVEQIYSELKKKYPNIWMATVYRAVDFLVNEKILRKIVNIDKISYYETLITPHAHFIDEETAQIIDIPLEEIWLDNSLFDKISDVRIIWKMKK